MALKINRIVSNPKLYGRTTWKIHTGRLRKRIDSAFRSYATKLHAAWARNRLMTAAHNLVNIPIDRYQDAGKILGRKSMAI